MSDDSAHASARVLEYPAETRLSLGASLPSFTKAADVKPTGSE